MQVGIEAINIYAGAAIIDVMALFKTRNLNVQRFDNLMMKTKSVGLPCEDPVTNGVNAAKPVVDGLSEAERLNIRLLIVSTESGLDFGKSLGCYIHEYLGLSRNCRVFEVKQACYGGTAALAMASAFVMSGEMPGAKALVISTDVARTAILETYAEPSQATGAAALLVGDRPRILALDFGATGCHSYEVMDTCRPQPETEVGNPDLSLLSYLDCLEKSYTRYAEKIEGADFRRTFDYLCFHTPFPGMVKGGHHKMLRDLCKCPAKEIRADFEKRVLPSLNYCSRVGNVYGASVFLALCSLIDSGKIDAPRRVGLFSYGSGCSAEFYSGVVSPKSAEVLWRMGIEAHLSDRLILDMDGYENLIAQNALCRFGIKNRKVETAGFRKIYEATMDGKGRLILDEVKEFHRKYRWS